MKKLLVLFFSALILLRGCTNEDSNKISSNDVSSEQVTTSVGSEPIEEEEMNLYIDENKIDVTWLDNDSVKALNNIKPLTINMHRYGGFEQVGSIGQAIISDDEETTTSPGDIVLYSSNQIVIFFGANSWAYTRLGHINLNEEQLIDLLDKDNVTLNIK